MNIITFKKSLLVNSILLSLAATSHDVIAQEQTSSPETVEVITVQGIGSSVKKSINDKRFASEILDTISAEDIGQLPDENIAEALQRVTGIQMSRTADGQGSSIQIRGLSDNNVEINGQTLAGSSANRSINFQDLPSELFSSIEIQKAPTADKIEGSLGGTINLRTRRPLQNNKDFIGSVTGKIKYAENADEIDPDLTLFILKNWRDTKFGDIGLIVNGGRNELTTYTETYGGGDFDDAPAVWLRRTGASVAPQGGNNVNGSNYFHPNRGASIYTYDNNIDLNGDGVSDDNDVYYIPGGFGLSEGVRTDQRDSFNTTLHWQPNDDLNIYFDAVLTQSDEQLTGSRYSIGTNAVRSGVLLNDSNSFEMLASNTPELGDVFLMTGGRIGAVTTRMGASPNLNRVERDSENFTLGGDWQASDSLFLSAEVSISEGNTNTLEQGALIMGIDANNNGALTGSDFAQYVDFSLNGNGLPNAFLYAPFVTQGANVVEELENPAEIDPADVSYDRLNYFQLNRVAQDTKNTADSFRFDGEYELNSDTLNNIQFGLRWAERSFDRVSFQNPNQSAGAISSLYQSGEEVRTQLNVQAIRVNPEQNLTADTRAAAEFLQSCLQSGGSGDFFNSESSNLSRTWTNTLGCSPAQLNTAFGLQDIRSAIADNPDVGVYEQLQNRYLVNEQTLAAYISAEFSTEIANFPLTGNFGVRYVETEVESDGFDRGQSLQRVTFVNEYNDFLPSLNANLALNDEMILRLGLSRTLGRPGLAALSPASRIVLDTDDLIPGIDGTGTGGNPFLESIHSNNIDLSYEWYYAESSLFSLAYFNKSIDTRIQPGVEQEPRNINGQLIQFTSSVNGPGTDIDGLEFAIQHSFEGAPGLLNHTGLGANYTLTNEDSEAFDSEGDPIARRGLSENSYNITAFYDDGEFSVRLAYNWRDEFTRREFVDLGFNQITTRLPEIEAARGQLDLTANYQWSKSLRFNFSAINLNDSETRRYMKYEPLLNYLAQPGRRFNLGIIYRF